MNVRFSGVRITGYQFNPEKVPVSDRVDFANSLLDGMRQQMQATLQPMEVPPQLQDLMARHADRYDFQTAQLVRAAASAKPKEAPPMASAKQTPTPPWTLKSFVAGLFNRTPVVSKAVQQAPPAEVTETPTPPEIQLAAFIFHSKTSGQTNLYTVALDPHDEAVDEVFSDDVGFYIPTSSMEKGDDGETHLNMEKGSFYVTPDHIGTVTTAGDILPKFTRALPNLEAALSAKPFA